MCREVRRVEPSIYSLAAQNDNLRREFIRRGDASERRREGGKEGRGSRRTEAHCQGVCVNVPLNLRAESVERVRTAITTRLGQYARLFGMNRMVELTCRELHSYIPS